jgi:excisionase family DNA binding protein
VPEYLTTTEVASLLKFTPATVREMVKRGEIKAVRFGRQWRVRADALVKPEVKPVRTQLSKKAKMELEMWKAIRNEDLTSHT